jgi:hypothetical protein
MSADFSQSTPDPEKIPVAIQYLIDNFPTDRNREFFREDRGVFPTEQGKMASS